MDKYSSEILTETRKLLDLLAADPSRHNLPTHVWQQVASTRAKVAEIDEHAQRPDREHIVEFARRQRGEAGSIEFDDDAVISDCESGGAYVQGWVWVGYTFEELATAVAKSTPSTPPKALSYVINEQTKS